MNRKKNKRKYDDQCMNDLQANEKNVNPDILVLPPNLLQKLGINLGNIKSGQGNNENHLAPEASADVKSKNQKPKIPARREDIDSNDEIQSSNIQTAHLMTESVLLSPTFNILQTNTVLGNEDVNDVLQSHIANNISNILENDYLATSNARAIDLDTLKCMNNDCEKEYNGVQKNLDLDTKNINIDQQSNTHLVSCNPKVNDNINFSLQLIPALDQLEHVRKPKNNSTDTVNKINIISEEVIDPKILHKIKLQHSPQEKRLLPVTIDTVISTKKSINKLENSNSVLNAHIMLNSNHDIIFDNQTQHIQKNNTKNEVYYVSPKLKLNNNQRDNNASNTDCKRGFTSNISINNKTDTDAASFNSVQISDSTELSSTDANMICESRNYFIESDTNDTQSKQENNMFESKSRRTSNDSDNSMHLPESVKDYLNSNPPLGNFKKLSKYLNQCLKVENGIINNINDKKVKLKECVQGVEKPGGAVINKTTKDANEITKTYHRRSKSKHVKNNLLKNYLPCDKNDNIDAPSTDYSNVQYCQELCICSDFGLLDKNGPKNNYEHIHFSKKENLQICPKLLFSIYDENIILPPTEEEFSEETKDMCSQICWVNAISVDNSDVPPFKIQKFNRSSNNAQNKIIVTSPSEHDNVSITKKSGDIGTIDNTNDSKVERVGDNLNLSTTQITIEDKTKASIEPYYNMISTHAETDNDNSKICGKSRYENRKNKNIANKRKRSLSDSTKPQDESVAVNHFTSKESIETITYGVCKKQLAEIEWENHNTKYIKYDIEVDIGAEMPTIASSSKTNVSEAAQCVTKSKSTTNAVESTLDVNSVDQIPPDQSLSYLTDDTTQIENSLVVKCGVCQVKVERAQWITHIGKDHNYRAWKHGQPELDFCDISTVHQHLYQISKKEGGLQCFKCGLRRKYVKSYLDHEKKCDGVMKEGTRNRSMNESTLSDLDKSLEVTGSKVSVKTEEGDIEETTCGVCQQRMTSAQWQEHAQRAHSYLAWEAGTEPLDMNSKDAIYEHLNKFCTTDGKLTCNYCSAQKRTVTSYLAHTVKCAQKENSDEIQIEVIVKREAEEELQKNITCAVCNEEMADSSWMDHIAREHNYLAWKQGEPEINLNNSEVVYQHLYRLQKEIGGLICNKCGRRRKYVKSYLLHIKTCDGSEAFNTIANESCTSEINTTMEETVVDVIDDVDDEDSVCGVCRQQVARGQWGEHAQREHGYLAWREGTAPLNIDDKKEVYEHLYKLSRKYDGLLCPKCGLRRKYVKSYLQHISACKGNENDSAENETLKSDVAIEDETGTSVCAVCKKEVENYCWWEHAQREHAYLAWKEGETPLNLDNEEKMNNYLYKTLKTVGGLTCWRCGLTRKYVKAYVTHVNTCTVTKSSLVSVKKNRDEYECAVCGEQGPAADWKLHALAKHYNIAWEVGDYPIDIKNVLVVEKHLKQYKQHYDKLACMACGQERVSYAGFYAHIIQCGKNEEEIEVYKNACDICQEKYLCIYKNQHMATHREQENARLWKLNNAENDNNEDAEEVPTGRRRAAERAKNVIKKYNSVLKDCAYKCPNCNFGADDEHDLEKHTCDAASLSGLSDGDNSDADTSSDEESGSSVCEAECDSPAEIIVERKKKKHCESNAASTKVSRIPFTIKNAKKYLEHSGRDFCKTHFTNETLFPQWRNCKYESVPDEELSKYMPLLKESCNISYSNNEWTTLKLFESNKEKGFSFFVGATVRSIAWAPGSRDEDPNVSEEAAVGAGVGAGAGSSWLAVASYRGADSPRIGTDCTYSAPGMLQIWEFGNNFRSDPKFVMGIAHNFGVVWALDWCPSGARDQLPGNSNEPRRLGLLAVACSDGFVHIFSVPYPSTIAKSAAMVYNLTPVAKLSLSRGERELYQATGISWSSVKGHSVIVVGYADGSMAFYNLSCDSPLLMNKEGETTVFYPYHDEKVHSTCITDVNIFANRASEAVGVGVVSSAAPTGAVVSVHGTAVRAHLHTTRAAFPTNWPSVLLTGNDAVVNQAVNEIDCWGVGRRVGSLQCWSGCRCCGAAVAFSPPALRMLHPHPVHADLHGVDVATIQMTSLGDKKTIMETGEEGAKAMSYEEVVKAYGIKLKVNKERKVNLALLSKGRDFCPERFPLADVVGMAFNPSPSHHRYLAIATHAGVIFVIKI